MARRDRHRWISDLCASAQSRRAAWRRSAIASRRRCALEWLPRRILLSATPTSITVSASANSAIYGQAVNASASPSLPSEGNVAFVDGAVANADYTIGYVAGALTVTRAALTIAANDQTMVYGGALRELTVTYSGLVNGDTPSTFGVSPNVAPTVTTPATNHVGSYVGESLYFGAPLQVS